MMELVAQGARFFELLGYALAVLSVAILGAGVLWALRKVVPERYRTLFLVGSCAALFTGCAGVFLLLTVSNPMFPERKKSQTPQRINPAAIELETVDPVLKVEIHVSADGSLLYQDQTITEEEFVAPLRREHPGKRLDVTILVDAEATYGDAMTVMGNLREQGVVQLSLKVEDR